MKVTQVLNEELQRSIAATGCIPECIYLGISQHNELCNMAHEWVGDYRTPETHGEERRMEWRGIKVYRVDAASYVGFGPRQPSPCG